MSVPIFVPIVEPCFDIPEGRIDLVWIVVHRPFVKVDDEA